MNTEIAKKRINEVLRPDTMTTSRSDFLATHVAVNNIELYSKFDPTDSSRSVRFQEAKSEEDVLSQFILRPDDNHQLLLVVGESGAGKSHLIRWFNERLLNERPEDEVILFVRRSDNTLKGTIKQLLDKPEISAIANKEVYKRLVEATAVIDENKLKGEILSKFILEVEHDEDQYADDDSEGEDKADISPNEKRKLVAFLKYKKVQSRMLEIDGPIDRIYMKVAQSGKVASDIDAFFLAEDFDFNDDDIEDIEENADKDTIKMARKLSLNPEKKDAIAKYLNQFLDVVIQRCSGLESGDFEEIFKDIRRALKKDGKRLTILIEDITSFTGVNAALLNALTTEHTGYGNEDLCRISSVIGITSGYFKDTFKTNYRDRVSLYINLPNDVFNDDYLYEFVARYLNSMSLEAEVLQQWISEGASSEKYPVHIVTEGKDWECYTTSSGKKLCLYPFTKSAIRNLYNYRLSTKQLRTPRYILQYIIEPIVKDALYRLDSFPNIELKPYNGNDSSALRTRIFNLTNVGDDVKERLYLFTCLWGNAKDNVIVLDDGTRLIAGVPESIYSELGLPILSNMTTIKASAVKPTVPHPVAPKPEITTSPSPAEQVNATSVKRINNAIDALNKWVGGSKINVGATTDNVVLLSNARDEITKYILSAINWQSEGVSPDTLEKISNSKYKNFIGFQNQSSGLDRVLYVIEATRKNQEIVEAFIRWTELGNKTWNFENGDYFALAVETWTERNKAAIVNAVKTFDKGECVYQEYAFGSELFRQIFFGQIDCRWKKYSSDLFLENDLCGKAELSEHSLDWNRLLDTILSTDKHKENRKVVLQYFNLIQGTRGGSKIYLNRPEFDALFNKVKKALLTLECDESSKKDNVTTRDEFRVQFEKIVTRVDKAYQSELQKITEVHDELEAVLGVSSMKSTELLELVEKIKGYYDEVNKAQLFAAYDANLINRVKSKRGDISRALEDIEKIIEEKDMIEALILMSHDPLQVINDFRTLVNKVVKDMENVNGQIKKKSGGFESGTEQKNELPYENEKKIVDECIELYERAVNK